MPLLPAGVAATPVRHEREHQRLSKSWPAIAFGLAALAIALPALLTAGAILMGAWAGLPWPGSVGLGVMGAAAMTAAARRSARRERVGAWALAAAWTGAVALLASALLVRGAPATLGTYLDTYYAALAWMMALAILPACRSTPGGRLKPWWRLLAVLWALLGGLAWLGAAYADNRPSAFFACLLILLALLVLCHFWFRLNATGIVAVNTLILLLLGLPFLDLLARCAGRLRAELDPHQQYYLYDVARKNPAAFGRWWNYYLAQFREAQEQIYLPDPDPAIGKRLRPNSRARLVQSTISINRLGFRGPEIPAEKGDAYRIVALGESTTFGITFGAEDRPWPELLDRMIRDRLQPRRPVQVINAGLPGGRLDQNLRRFVRDILPLKPDLVISYHGINAFDRLRDAVPFAPGARAPAYQDRPIRLLADVEYRLQLIRFQHRRRPDDAPRPRPPADPLGTPYAQIYRQLIQTAQTNRVRLVLANYAMAVNDRSERALIEFYQVGYPAAVWQIQANRVHSDLVRQLAAQHPEVTFVDTQPHLDGEHAKFTDLVHFAPAGDQQIAETFFNALRPILEADLAGGAFASPWR
jgi:lysophospholipase L1-like esterase